MIFKREYAYFYTYVGLIMSFEFLLRRRSCHRCPWNGAGTRDGVENVRSFKVGRSRSTVGQHSEKRFHSHKNCCSRHSIATERYCFRQISGTSVSGFNYGIPLVSSPDLIYGIHIKLHWGETTYITYRSRH